MARKSFLPIFLFVFMCTERVDPQLKTAMRAFGWQGYLTPASEQVSDPMPRRIPRTPITSSSQHFDLKTKTFSDGKQIKGTDLGAPGVLTPFGDDIVYKVRRAIRNGSGIR